MPAARTSRASGACSWSTSPPRRSSSSPRCSAASRAPGRRRPARSSRRGIGGSPTTDRAPTSPHHPRSIHGPRSGTVRLTVSDVDRSRAFYERALGPARHGGLDDGTFALGAAGGPPLAGRAPWRQRSAAPGSPRHGSVPPGGAGAHARRPGACAGPAGRGALAAGRRLGSPGQRGAVSVRSRRQRDRDLPRPPA